MNKSELVSALASKTDLTQKDVSKVIDAFVGIVGETLKKGDDITLVGFGAFKVSQRQARTGRNPKTGEPLQIAASKVPQFKAGKALKDAIA
jgi:DNA-binding protein HU-beta